MTRNDQMTPPTLLPLPKGEGRGEGEQPAHLAHAPAFRLQPPASSLQPLLLACATCYGQSDAPMARGMNWGIFSLLVIVAMVLATFVVFFIYLARRSANLNRGRASVLASPDFLGLPEELNLTSAPFLPARPKPLVKSARPVP